MNENTKSIDVFIDFEGLGMQVSASRNVDKIEWLMSRLGPALSREGFGLGTVTAFASARRGKWLLPSRFRSRLATAFENRGAQMVWSRTIADIALMSTVKERLSRKRLADHVLLITNDADFVPLVDGLKAGGHFVFVSGPAMSKDLVAAASRAVPIRELATGKPKLPRQAVKFNPLPIS